MKKPLVTLFAIIGALAAAAALLYVFRDKIKALFDDLKEKCSCCRYDKDDFDDFDDDFEDDFEEDFEEAPAEEAPAEELPEEPAAEEAPAEE